MILEVRKSQIPALRGLAFGGIKNVFKVIKYGVVEKGMIAWQTQLSPNQMQEVASYVLSLHSTTPAAPKQPEGEIWKEEKTD